jgi:polyhydroxybutyrate depolymerase
MTSQRLPTLLFGMLFVGCSLRGGGAHAKEPALRTIDRIPPSCRESSLEPGDWIRTFPHGKRERRYIVHVPPGYDPARKVPVVLFLHGGAGNAKSTRNWPGWDAQADQEGFLVVYPDGAGPFKETLHSWNAGNCGGWAYENGIDDVGFIEKVLDELERISCIDGSRLYATGISNGAMMSYRLAAESNRLAAIGPVAGTLCRDIDSVPARPVSVIHFHGTADDHAPFEGGEARKGLPLIKSRNVYRSVDETLALWRRYIGASEQQPEITRGDAVRYGWGGGREGSEVILWKLRGGGHTWPGSPNVPGGERQVGKTNFDVSATETIWRFFEQHALSERGEQK